MNENVKTLHQENGIVTITVDDDIYPDKLKCLDNPPEVIYAKGNLELLNMDRHSAIIGRKDVSMKGMDVAIGLGNMLSMKGEIIVSGLEEGCDTGAHLGTLGAGGRTIAILASPITQISPVSNTFLGEKIVNSGGLLISEYAHDAQIDEESYRRCALLQAAMSDGLIVVESLIDDSTMITVDYALEMGKPLGAYRHPGGFDMTDTSEGNEHLIITKKAVPIRNIKDAEKFIEGIEDTRRNK